MDRFWDCTVHSSHKALVCILMFLRKGDERWVWWSVLICKILHCLYALIQWSYLDGLGVGMSPGEILGLNVGSDIPDPWRTGFLGRNTIFVCLVCSVIFLWASFPKPVEAGAAALPGLCATFNARGTARKLSEHGYKNVNGKDKRWPAFLENEVFISVLTFCLHHNRLDFYSKCYF